MQKECGQQQVMGHKVSLCKKDGNKKDGSNKDGLLHGESADDIRRFHVGHGCMVQGEMAVLRHQTAVEGMNDFEEYKQRKGQVRHLVRQVLNGERSHPVVTVRKLALATQGKYRVPSHFEIGSISVSLHMQFGKCAVFVG